MFYTQFNKIISKLKNLFSHVLIYFDFFSSEVEMYGLVYMKQIRLTDQTRSGLDVKIQYTETSLSPIQVRLQTTANVLRLILLDSGSRKDAIKNLVLSAKKTWVQKNVENFFQNTMLLKSVILLPKHPEIYSLLSNFV